MGLWLLVRVEGLAFEGLMMMLEREVFGKGQ
jgi:hypothetical protein